MNEYHTIKNSFVESKGAEAKCIIMFLACLGWDKNEVHDLKPDDGTF